MIARSYFSTNKILKFALEEIYLNFKKDILIDDYDFVLFAISPKYYPEDVKEDISKIFKNNFLAFNAIHSFSNNNVVSGVSAMFIKFEKNGNIDTFVCECKERNKEKLLKYLLSHKNSLNIIVSTYNMDIANFLEKIDLKDSVSLIGGIVSGEEIEGTYRGNLYFNHKIIEKGFAVLSFNNVEFSSSIATGYRPLGPSLKVRLAKENRVYLIDYSDASLVAKSLLKGLDNIKDLWNSPILIKRGEQFIPRTFKDIKENLYVEFFGNFKQNEEISLSFANEELLLKEDRKRAAEVKNSLHNCDMIFDFSCIARQYILKDKADDELEIFSEIINAPLFGFFTFGEMINVCNNNVTLFNQTSLIAGVKEC